MPRRWAIGKTAQWRIERLRKPLAKLHSGAAAGLRYSGVALRADSERDATSRL
jgi:hypothetical protein